MTRWIGAAQSPVGGLRLWLGVLGAPAAWLVHLMTRYTLVPVACAAGKPSLLHVVTAACATAAVAAGLLGLANARAARRDGSPGQSATENARFMGNLGALLGALFLLIIFAEMVPALLQGPCTGLPGPVVHVIVFLMGPRVAFAGVAPVEASSARFFDEPLLTAALLVVTAWYLIGLRALLRRVVLGRRALAQRACLFLSGLVTVAAALCSPLDELAEALFSAHMAQHLLLVSVAAPLFALSAPRAVFAWALPGSVRRRLGRLQHSRLLRAVFGVLGRPVTVFLLHAVVLWAWHIPSLYAAALTSAPLHALEHGTFLGTSIAFFGTLVRAGAPGRIGHGVAMLYAFVASLQCGALGVLLASARVPFYPDHAEGAAAWGLGLLEDQQLAGLLMWVPGGAAYAIAALLLARAWLRAAASAPQWEVSCDR